MPHSVFINKVLLEHDHTHLFIYQLYLLFPVIIKLSRYNKAQNVQHLTHLRKSLPMTYAAFLQQVSMGIVQRPWVLIALSYKYSLSSNNALGSPAPLLACTMHYTPLSNNVPCNLRPPQTPLHAATRTPLSEHQLSSSAPNNNQI